MDKLLNLEEKFRQNNQLGDFQLPMFGFEKGDLPIIFTAPHSVKTMKKSKKSDTSVIKDNEVFTGSLCLRLNQLCGVHAMVRNNYPFTSYVNPVPYYSELMNYIEKNKIKYLVDIHGASRKSTFDVAPGINHGMYINYDHRYYRAIVESFNSNGINDVNFDTKFQASTLKTISASVFHNLGIKTTQLEINRNYRDEKNELEKLKMLLKALETYSNYVCELVKKDDISMRLIP